MLRRQRNQGRLTSLTDAGGNRGHLDLVWILLATAAAAAGSVRWGATAWLLERRDTIDVWVLDASLALSVVAPIGLCAWLLLRYRRFVAANGGLLGLPHRDSLTGLPDRHLLNETLTEVLSRTRPGTLGAAVLFLDLDGFKAANATYGHEVGDGLMAAVAARLRAGLGERRFVARYSGDEFVVVDPEVISAEHGVRLARELVTSLESPFDIGEDRIGISAHVGVAFGKAGDDAGTVLRDADTAMTAARTRPDRVAVFESSMRGRLTPRNAERRLEEALQRGQFRLFYQPVVSLRDRTIMGVECLLRWADPTRGFIRASEFMPSLEETGLIVPVGRWILQEACRQARHWADIAPRGLRPVRVSVNISPRQLSQSDFIDLVRESVENSGVDPAQLHLEVSETALVTNPRLTWATLGATREIGVGLVLDDFGTGYSAISHLRNFDFELVKLDRSLILGAGQAPENEFVISHIVGLARSLGIAAVAEGVSEASQVTRLLELGCQLGQGQYFADALPGPFIGQLITRDSNRLTSAPAPTAAGDPVASPGTIVAVDRRGPRSEPASDA